MRPPILCMGVLAFTGTVAAPQNDGKFLCRFGIAWLHLPQYQKGGVQLVLMIPPVDGFPTQVTHKLSLEYVDSSTKRTFLVRTRFIFSL